MNKYQFCTLIIQAFAAIGTIIIAILAIYGDAIRAKLSGPRLKIFLRDSCGEKNYKRHKIPQIYHHLIVVNSRRSSQANNVRVVLTQLFKENNRHEMVSQMLSGPLQLTWQFPSENPQYITVGPDRICDLGFLTRSADHYQPSLYFYPNNFNGFVRAGEKIRLGIMALADNAESNELLIDISWDGKWSDDLNGMKENLKVREIQDNKESLNIAKKIRLYIKNHKTNIPHYINKLTNIL